MHSWLNENAMHMIEAERDRQVRVEGYDAAHDGDHGDDIARAAACYAMPERVRLAQGHVMSFDLRRHLWPWQASHWKPTPDDRLHELAKAGALIAADIERHLRKAEVEALGSLVDRGEYIEPHLRPAPGVRGVKRGPPLPTPDGSQ